MPLTCYDEQSSQGKMTLTSLTFEEIDALLALIEFHDDWEFVTERVGTDVNALYEKLSEMRDEV
jgi:hypothetical protein